MGDNDQDRGVGEQLASSVLPAGMAANLFGPTVGADQAVTGHQSGFSRLMSSILCAICCAPCLLILCCILWGWNEKRAVCYDRAISQGKNGVVSINCNAAGDHTRSLVMFSCAMDTAAVNSKLDGTGDFSSTSWTGIGMTTTVEMYQCIESASSQTTTQAGGSKTTVTTYSYSLGWSSRVVTPVNPQKATSQEMLRVCGVMSATPNPSLPAGAPVAGTQYTQNPVKVGAFILPSTIFSVSQIPISTDLNVAAPAGWTKEGSYFITTKYSNANQIGKIRVRITTDSGGAPMITALGQNTGGALTAWKSESTWLCSGDNLSDGRLGTYTKDQLFDKLKAENKILTWFIRILGFCLAWFAFTRFCEPCEVLADCIPFCGPMLGNMIEVIACVIAYFPACACCGFICGIVWAAMRPTVGVPLLLISLCIFGGFIAFKLKKTKEKKEKAEKGDPEQPEPEKVGNAKVSSTE